jgi:hypothetical protein
MNTTEMLAQLRLNCLLEDTAPDYTDDVLLRELTDSLRTKFQDTVVGFRNGIWQTSYYQPLTAGFPLVRLARQVTVLGKVEIGNGSSANYNDINFTRLPQVQEGHSDLFESSFNSLGTPQFYVMRGSNIVLLPTPDNAGYVLRVTHFRKPPRLFASQNNVSGTSRGLITAVNQVTRTITVNAQPFDMSLSTPAAISGTVNIDVIRDGGWHDHSVSNQPATVSGSTLIVGGTQPLYDVGAGDWVRVFDQSDWPMLPTDFHRCVVDVASTKILIQRGYQQKASNYAGDVTADLQRFETLYSNRVREEPRIARAPLMALRRWRLR